jgi:hypothetical protein
MRRRLWWQICVLDVRVSEENNTDPAILECNFDTKFPLNIDDAALYPEMEVLPLENPGRTDMIFALVRLKTSYFCRKLVFSNKFLADNSYAQLDDVQRAELVDVCYREIAQGYLQNCDNNVPLDFMAGSSSLLIFAKIKLTIQHPFSPPHCSTKPDRSVLTNCLEILEHAYELRTAPQLRKWFWLFQDYMEWDALACALLQLCQGVPRSMVARSWAAVDRIYADWKEHTIHNLLIEKRWHHIEQLRERAVALRDGSKDIDESSQSYDPERETILGVSDIPPRRSRIYCPNTDRFQNHPHDSSIGTSQSQPPYALNAASEESSTWEYPSFQHLQAVDWSEAISTGWI